jgi:hypothetical protein
MTLLAAPRGSTNASSKNEFYCFTRPFMLSARYT